MAKGSKGDGREGREWRKYTLLRKNSKHKIKPKNVLSNSNCL